MILNGLDGLSDSLLKGCWIGKVLEDLVLRVGVQDHSHNAAGQGTLYLGDAAVEMLSEELLLLFGRADLSELLHSDRWGLLGWLLLLLWDRHRHGLVGNLRLLVLSRSPASECWERRLVDGYALRLLLAGVVPLILLIVVRLSAVVILLSLEKQRKRQSQGSRIGL